MIDSSVEALNLPSRGTKFLSEKTFSASSSYAWIVSAAESLNRPRSIAMRLLVFAISQLRQGFTIAFGDPPSCARPANEIKKLSRFRGLRQRQSLLNLFHQVLNNNEFRQPRNAAAICIRISQHEDEDEQWSPALYPARACEGLSSCEDRVSLRLLFADRPPATLWKVCCTWEAKTRIGEGWNM